MRYVQPAPEPPYFFAHEAYAGVERGRHRRSTGLPFPKFFGNFKFGLARRGPARCFCGDNISLEAAHIRYVRLFHSYKRRRSDDRGFDLDFSIPLPQGRCSINSTVLVRLPNIGTFHFFCCPVATWLANRERYTRIPQKQVGSVM